METLDADDGPLFGDRQFTTDGVRNDMCGGGSRNRRVIDFIFTRAMGKNFTKTHRWIPTIEKQWSRYHESLSDHNPVAIEVSWE